MATLPGTRPTPRLLTLFVITTLLPAGAVGWLGWRLLDQDKRLERQRIQDLAEAAADRVSAVIERELSTLERRLASTTAVQLDGADLQFTTMVRVDREGHATLSGGCRLYTTLGALPFPMNRTTPRGQMPNASNSLTATPGLPPMHTADWHSR